MKKLLSLLLIIALIAFAFVACGNNEANEANTPANTTNEVAAEEEVDVMTTASIVTDADAFVKALSADGTWIAATLNDITLTEDLVVEGEFLNKEKVARKIAVYTQDADHNILESFTLTVPKMIVRSENLKFQGGTFVGDIYVEANGFTVQKATVEGNIYFATQEYKDSFVMDEENGKVTGSMEVQ